MQMRFLATLSLAALVACGDDAFDVGVDAPVTVEQGVTATTTFTASADTHVRGGGDADGHFGHEALLRVEQYGPRKSLVRFDDASLSTTLTGRTVVSASLQLFVGNTASGFPATGQSLVAHRLTTPWTESGATYNCAVDSIPGNWVKNCSGATAWALNGPAFPYLTPGSSTTIVNGKTGWVSFDVTADVAAFAGGAPNLGWLVKRDNESLGGNITFRSRENSTNKPRLVVVTSGPCGDGVLDGGNGEGCDDGNGENGDGCTAACKVEVCGDGVVNNDGAEECDDGNVAAGDGCDASCAVEAACGDGTVDDGEGCDDGNNDDGDGCAADCIDEFCGDFIVNDGGAEECDDGNDVDGDGCTGCVEDVCGDFVRNNGEECDDNDVDGDGCTDCVEDVCGDGVVNDGGAEECDDGNAVDGDACTACVVDVCGDGVVNDNGAEECDDGNAVDGDGCAACILEVCGDGVRVGAEECDDGNGDDGDGCSAACAVEFCGDGVVNAGVEECDDGNDVDGDGCTSCVIEFCGDRVVNNGEECDDGDVHGGDGCGPSCRVERCGDGLINVNGEECDDGNEDDDDGCAACVVRPFCGDGVVDDDEFCDDGNDDDADDCFACRLTSRFVSTFVPPAKNLPAPRLFLHPSDRRVLILGGGATLDSFNPLTNSALTLAAPPTSAQGTDACRVLLNDGRLLVAGGHGTSLTEARRFSFTWTPTTNVWAQTPAMPTGIRVAPCGLLADGRVAIAGTDANGVRLGAVFQPTTSQWTSVPGAGSPHVKDPVTLPNGDLLFADGAFAEVFRAATLTFEPAGIGSWNVAVSLRDGRVFLVRTTGETAIWDATSGTLAAAAPRGPFDDPTGGTAIVLADGKVLMTGVAPPQHTASTPTIDTYDPLSDTWVQRPETLQQSREGHGMALLDDGRVLVVGGVQRVQGVAQSLPLARASEVLLDLNPPRATLDVPATVSGVAAAVRALTTPSAVGAIAAVDVLVDGVLIGTAVAPPWEVPWDTSALNATSEHTVQALVVDEHGNTGSSLMVRTSIAAAPAHFDEVLQVPACGQGASCESGPLLVGRGAVGPEPHASNAPMAGCTDGDVGAFHVASSIDRIQIVSADGGPLRRGGRSTIRVEGWSAGPSTTLFIYAGPGTNPQAWARVGTFSTNASGGFSGSILGYVLPAFGDKFVIHARMGPSNIAGLCSSEGTTDHDELAVDLSP